MGYEAPELTTSDIQTELAKLLTCTTNKLTDTEVGRIDAAISSAGGAAIGMLDIWGEPVGSLTVTTTPGDKTLSNVVIPNLGTYTIEAAYAMFRILQMADDSASENRATADTYIQIDKAAAGYINAALLRENFIRIPGSTNQNYYLELMGSIDISSRVANNATTNFKWASAVVAGNSLYVRSSQTGIRLIVS